MAPPRLSCVHLTMAKNRCQACGHVWHPRTLLVSHQCPACRSPAVMLVPQTNPLAGCGTVLLILLGVSAVVTAILFVLIAKSCNAPTATAPAPEERPHVSARDEAPPTAAAKAAAPADDPPSAGGGGCTCGDGTPGCCGPGCCSHHGGTGGGHSHHGKR